MRMEVLERGDTAVWIRLEGRLDLKGVEEIELAFTVKASKTARPVVVDLRGVTFVGSLAIGMFVAAARNLALHGSRMSLFGATPHIDEVLRMAGVDQVAGLLSTEEEALRASAVS